MCGIAGIVSFSSRIERSELELMGRAMQHRGPDGEGIWLNATESVGLVHRRLAIIDVSELGHQPMRSRDGRYVIVFNGEIFNFLELRHELEGLGAVFVSSSDTEVILEAWRYWGEAMLLRFNGMWALAIVDNVSGAIFFARDRFGIKPLLYAQTGQGFAFASEMRVLRQLPWIPGAIDLHVASRILFDPFSVEGSAATLCAAIQRLPAGHCALLDGRQLTLKRWWRTVDHLVAPPDNAAEAAAEFKRLFFDSIRLRMRSDVPLGTCLSGGFDSTAVASAMASVGSTGQQDRFSGDWRHAFIASFPGESNDETPDALEAATFAGVKPHVFAFRGDIVPDNIDQILADLDDIHIGLPSAPWELYRELRRAGIVVSLDGHGADEMLGGYLQGNENLAFMIRNTLARIAMGSDVTQRMVENAKAVWLTRKQANFLRHHRWSAPSALPLPGADDPLPAQWGAFNRRLYRMFHGTVLPTILRNFDRLSMAHGIEVRMPFMDWRLVTFAMSLPDRMRYADGLNKLVARQAMQGAMPERIRINRRKVGFNSPMPGWMSGALGEWSLAQLDRPEPEFAQIVDVPLLRSRIQALNASRQWNWDNVGRLWPYINLQWWLKSSRDATLMRGR